LHFLQVEAKLALAEKYGEIGEKVHGLTNEELAAIRFYTQETIFYGLLNRSLRSGRAEAYLPYLKLLLRGLIKLPPCQRRVFRSVGLNLGDKLDGQVGHEVTWWALTSTSVSLQSVVNDPFLKNGNGTIFSIETDTGVDIAPFSEFRGEEELLLFPGTTLKVKGKVKIQGMPMIQLVEVSNPGFDIFPRPRDVSVFFSPHTPHTLTFLQQTALDFSEGFFVVSGV